MITHIKQSLLRSRYRFACQGIHGHRVTLKCKSKMLPWIKCLMVGSVVLEYSFYTINSVYSYELSWLWVIVYRFSNWAHVGVSADFCLTFTLLEHWPRSASSLDPRWLVCTSAGRTTQLMQPLTLLCPPLTQPVGYSRHRWLQCKMRYMCWRSNFMR